MTSTEIMVEQDPSTAQAADEAGYAAALLNMLADSGEEQKAQSDSQRAMLNILEDLDSQRVRLESAQKALINMLDDLEVERRELDKANIKLQEVNEAMRSFVATAAHDMRSPLASMVGFSSLLAENWAELSDDQRLTFVTTIDRQSHKLTGLVNDLLTLSSIEGGVLNTQPERVVLSEAIRECLEASRVDATSVSVSCAPDLVARVDPLHLARIIDNYLQNAFKYGEPPVRVEATRVGDMVEVRVIDHGPGVPPEFEAKLFGKFARPDIPSMRKKRGTGLGLSIVRGLAEANGGTTRYQANLPHGACFIVVLPVDTESRHTDTGSRTTDERPHR